MIKFKVLLTPVRCLLLGLMVWMLSACHSHDIKDYSATTPELKLEQFFNGDLKAYGIVLGRNGELKRRFEADLRGTWQDEEGLLEEWFSFADGERSTRNWRLKKVAENQYQGQAEDVIGIAEGEVQGSALYWRYDLEIKVDGDPITVTLDDWMYLVTPNRLMNVSQIEKFGINFGQVVLVIEKL